MDGEAPMQTGSGCGEIGREFAGAGYCSSNFPMARSGHGQELRPPGLPGLPAVHGRDCAAQGEPALAEEARAR